MRHAVQQMGHIRDRFAVRLRRAGSHANFVLIAFADGAAADRVGRVRWSAGYLLRGMAGYDLSHCLWATTGCAADMDSVAEILEGLT